MSQLHTPDLSLLPTSYRQMLEQECLENETVLWYEKANRFALVKKSQVLFWIQIPFWMFAIGILWLGSGTNLVSLIMASLTATIGCVLLVSAILVCSDATQTLYALTDHRVLILVGTKRGCQCHSYHRHNLKDIEFWQTDTGTGTIILDRCHHLYDKSNWLGFYGIEKAKDIYQLLCEMRDTLPHPEVVGSLQSQATQKQLTPMTRSVHPGLVQAIHDTCWENETILWQGQPDPAVSNDNGVWGKLEGWPLNVLSAMLAVPLALIGMAVIQKSDDSQGLSLFLFGVLWSVFFLSLAGLGWSLVARLKHSNHKSSNQLYALTNLRLISYSIRPRHTNLLTLFYHQMPPVEAQINANGSGSLVLDAKPGCSNERLRLLDKVGLYQIPQARLVKQLLDQQIIAAQSDHTIHPTPTLDIESADDLSQLGDDEYDLVREKIKVGETVIWVGKPWVKSFPVLHRKTAARTIYILTDKRVIRWAPKTFSQKLVAYEYVDVEYLDLERLPDGMYSLIFGRDYSGYENGDGCSPVTEHGFFYVAAVPKLHDFISHMVYRDRHGRPEST